MIRPSIVVAILALLVLSIAPRVSQAQLELSPFVARVNPTNTLAVAEDASAAFQMSAFTVYGARLGWSLSPRLALEGSAAYGRGDLTLISGAFLTFDTGVLQADLRARLRLAGGDGGAGVHLTGGVGMNDIQNALFDAADQTASTVSADMVIAGILGIGGTLPIAGGVALRFDFEDRIHSGEIEIDSGGGTPYDDARLQHDLVLAIGIVIPAR